MDEAKKSCRVLLVDDEEEFTSAAAKVLRRRGFEILVAPNGIKAIEVVEEQRVDAVVLDMKMPGLDGAAVFDRIHKIRPELPVIVLTGHDALTPVFEMTRKGVFDYLLKPCDMEELAGRLRSALERALEASGPSSGNESNPWEGARVLLVDDETDFLETMKRVLERRMITVQTAESGTRALALLDEGGVDVVVLDVKMPGMDGLAVMDCIMAAPVAREVVLLTGHPTVDAAVRGMKKGAFEYLVKPPDVEELVRVIGRAYQRLKERNEEKRRSRVDEILRRYPD